MRPLCAICDMTNATTEICATCRADPANVDWCEPSALEQTAEDVDLTVAVAGGDRLESIYGGRRKFDTPLARRVIRIAIKNKTRKVWRSRETVDGAQLKRRKRVERGLSLRQIATKARCSVEYVRLVLAWMRR